MLAGGLLAAAVAAAPAAQAAGCQNGNGVTVVVDFAALDGGVQTGCAVGAQSSGLAALANAGFLYDFVPRQRGLVCTINAKPSPCNGAPTTAYWSYWHGSPGGAWSYSTIGAGSYAPPAGSVEGWAFGAGAQPGIGPPALPAPPPAPKPKPKPPASTTKASSPAPGGGGSGGSGGGGSGGGSGGTAGGGGSGGQPGGSSGGAGSSRTPAGGRTSAAATAGPRTSGTDSPQAAGTTGSTVNAAPAAQGGDAGGGIGTGVLITLGLLAALGGGAAWTARRRRAAG